MVPTQFEKDCKYITTYIIVGIVVFVSCFYLIQLFV